MAQDDSLSALRWRLKGMAVDQRHLNRGGRWPWAGARVLDRRSRTNHANVDDSYVDEDKADDKRQTKASTVKKKKASSSSEISASNGAATKKKSSKTTENGKVPKTKARPK